jgi:uncharacterized membrane protein (DUF373 family)
MLEVVQKFERIIYGALIVMLMVVLTFAVVELGWVLFSNLFNPPVLLLENHELVNVLGIFLLVLIGVELLDTILAYFKESTIHVEIVVLLALIAISRKVILLDPTTTDPLELIGIGIMVIGLAGAYFLVKRAAGGFGITTTAGQGQQK